MRRNFIAVSLRIVINEVSDKNNEMEKKTAGRKTDFSKQLIKIKGG